MNRPFLFLLTLSLSVCLLQGCGGNDVNPFPLEKKYWTAEDYQAANLDISTSKFNNKDLPNMDDPKTAPIFNKLIDTNNVAVVMNDNQLGIVNRSKFASDMFTEYKTMVENYSGIDRADKYQYPAEFAEALKFGLNVQLYYIASGNEKIIKDADDPKSTDVVRVVTDNKNILIRNYDIYLDHINYEDRFNDKGLAIFVSGLKEYFPRLINDYSADGDFSEMNSKLDNMLKKAKNPGLVVELNNIKTLIAGKTKK